jgi:hypothetical protein
MPIERVAPSKIVAISPSSRNIIEDTSLGLNIKKLIK